MANPKLAMIPTGYKAGKVYSVLPESGVGDFTFDRDSLATKVNENGLIETMAIDVPRLDYTDGGCPSLLLEPESTNEFTYSEDFTNAIWGKNTALVATANASVSPSGLTNATLLYNTGIENRIGQNVSIVSGKTYTMSVYIKNNGGDNVITFEVIGYSSKKTTITNEWARYDYTIIATSTSSVQFRFLSFNKNINLYAWGAQVEESEYTTSYIPTSASTVTRVGETCTGAGDASTFNDSEGVLMAEISALHDGSDGNRYLSVNSGSTTNSVRIYFGSVGDIQTVVTSSNATTSYMQYGGATISEINKIIITYSDSDFTLWVNGYQVASDSRGTGATPIGLDRVNYNAGVGGTPFYGNTKQLQYFDSILTDAELETLTSWQSFLEMANAQNYTII